MIQALQKRNTLIKTIFEKENITVESLRKKQKIQNDSPSSSPQMHKIELIKH